MKLEGALERARAIAPGQHARARDLHYDLENELEHGLYNEDEAAEGERALAHLEANHPGVREASRAVTRPPNLSRRANRTIAERSSEPPLPAAPPAPAPPASSPPRSSSSSYPRRGGGRRGGGFAAGRVAERAFGFSSSDVSGNVIRGLQVLLAAGIVYQVLEPKGATAFGGILRSIGNGVRVLVDPIDPLGGLGSSSQVQQGYAQAQGEVQRAQQQAPDQGQFDTPTGRAPYQPPTNLSPAGGFDTPGGYAPYKPPPGIPVVPPAAAAGTGLFDTPTGRRRYAPPPGIPMTSALRVPAFPNLSFV